MTIQRSSRRTVAAGIAGVGMCLLGLTTIGQPVHALASTAITPTTCTAGSPETNVSENGWICPVEIGSSGGLGEPTLIHDDGAGNSGVDRLFVTAPQAIGNVQQGGSPLFTSLDGGNTWGAPVRSTECTGLSGGDTDLVTDSTDDVFATDLWLGNSCISVSEDHGQSFAAGDPYGNQLAPGDDRPWLAYSASANEIFTTYDGENALRVDSSAPLVTPAAGVQMVSETNAIPESAINTSSTPSSVRECVCPPGGIAVDNSSGAPNSHSGRVYVAYSYQGGEAISYADPTCSPTGGCAILQTSWNSAGAAPTVVPNSGSTGSAFEDEWNFSPIKVDSNGTVYVMFARAPGFSSSGNTADSHGVQIYYAYSTDGGQTFSSPVYLSTEDGADGSTGTTTFPTMDVVAPGVLDLAWYGTPNAGDPNSVPSTAQWNVYYTRVSGADTATPTVATPEIAISDMHNGCIQTGGGAACADRSLLDFFQLADTNGSPNVIYTDGDVTNNVNLFFTKLTVAPSGGTVPEAPFGALLLVPGLAIVALAVRSERRRRSASPPIA